MLCALAGAFQGVHEFYWKENYLLLINIRDVRAQCNNQITIYKRTQDNASRKIFARQYSSIIWQSPLQTLKPSWVPVIPPGQFNKQV
jgi:hypothetical protein